MKTQIAIENYFSHLESENYSKYTLKLYKINMDHFLKVAPNKVEDISKDTVKKFTAQLQKDTVSYKTKNGRLITLRSFLKFTARETELNVRWSDIELFADRTDSGKINVPPQELISLFLEPIVREMPHKKIIEARSDALTHTIYSTGLRLSELVSLNRSDIFPTGMDIDSKEAKEIDTVQITIVGKGSKVRLVFINRDTLEIIRKYLRLRIDDCDALFVTIRTPIVRIKHRMAEYIIGHRVKWLEEQGKLPIGTLVSPHTLRHAYATNLIASGVGIMAVKELMGHASITTTQRYLHLSNADLKDEYNKVYK